ncbi:hypothetical protein ACE1B4_09335 [Aeromonas veronii]|uniref:hypothetical protein n=2 Tax=Aeromonas veronii TaxID=654 RepID=UPI00042A429F|nr:hypothetical protein [Aeromonas veronii]QMS74904.1 hypothetical protein M001_012315 [Aeromonas veronii Hm21]HDO1312798.1 hypothetical protein [Aeromonas veronii]HDO1316718.1 hypothetical protein [Aeromonas veronii]HDO1355905.1 hypothetical protein [Aeromonas veronii]
MSRIAIVWLLLWCSGLVSAATLNVTFVVKNDGRVEVSDDWGGRFDINTGLLRLEREIIPVEFRDSKDWPSTVGQFWAFSPVGYHNRMVSVRNDVFDMSIRIEYLLGKGHAASNWGPTPCQTDPLSLPYGNYQAKSKTSSDYGGRCSSPIAWNGAGGPFYLVESLTIVFFDGLPGEVNRLASRKIPAGKYESSNVFNIENVNSIKQLIVNTTIIVEPSLSAVNMPSELTLDVRKEAGMLVGQGAILASVTGTFGWHLKIEPRVSVGPVGKLSLGSSVIPYNLDVTPQGHDYARRNLVDGQAGTLSSVILSLEGSQFDYRLRFDVNFRVPVQSLQSGKYQGALTLVFTTSDI